MQITDKPTCNLNLMQAYLKNELNEDDLLDFLMHLDECEMCKAILYQSIKGTHDHFYRKAPNKRLEKEMKEISKMNQDDFKSDSDEMTDVA
jgi:Putative zinc-finger